MEFNPKPKMVQSDLTSLKLKSVKVEEKLKNASQNAEERKLMTMMTEVIELEDTVLSLYSFFFSSFFLEKKG